jgi:transcriptional regulator with XRE-family HTH domain
MAERRTRREIEIERRDRELRRTLGAQLRQLREDAGISQSALARAAGISAGFQSKIEDGTARPTHATYIGLAEAVGGEFRAWFEPGLGVSLRDRYQAPMIEGLLRIAHPRWVRFTEVVVRRPIRGIIDLVLCDLDEPILVAGEAHSQVRRLEQQQRWANQKADAVLGGSDLPLLRDGGPPPPVSKLLILRDTTLHRRLASDFRETIRAGYPADPRAAYDALTGRSRWPGPAVLWVRVRGAAVEVLRDAPGDRRRS